MDARTEGRVFGFIAIAISLFGIAAFYAWTTMPTLVVGGLLAAATICGVLGVWPFLPREIRDRMDPLLAIALTAAVVQRFL